MTETGARIAGKHDCADFPLEQIDGWSRWKTGIELALIAAKRFPESVESMPRNFSANQEA